MRREWRARNNEPLKTIKPPGVKGWMSPSSGAIHSAILGNDFSQLVIGPLLGQTVPTRVNNLGSLCVIPFIFTQGSESQLPGGDFRIRLPTDLTRAYTLIKVLIIRPAATRPGIEKPVDSITSII